jgi:hypothetical protein
MQPVVTGAPPPHSNVGYTPAYPATNYPNTEETPGISYNFPHSPESSAPPAYNEAIDTYAYPRPAPSAPSLATGVSYSGSVGGFVSKIYVYEKLMWFFII